jgi:hypothetical protein
MARKNGMGSNQYKTRTGTDADAEAPMTSGDLLVKYAISQGFMRAPVDPSKKLQTTQIVQTIAASIDDTHLQRLARQLQCSPADLAVIQRPSSWKRRSKRNCRDMGEPDDRYVDRTFECKVGPSISVWAGTIEDTRKGQLAMLGVSARPTDQWWKHEEMLRTANGVYLFDQAGLGGAIIDAMGCTTAPQEAREAAAEYMFDATFNRSHRGDHGYDTAAMVRNLESGEGLTYCTLAEYDNAVNDIAARWATGKAPTDSFYIGFGYDYPQPSRIMAIRGSAGGGTAIVLLDDSHLVVDVGGSPA